MESHGTKVLIYNLWMNDDGLLELDFDDDDKVNIMPTLFYFNIRQERNTKEPFAILNFCTSVENAKTSITVTANMNCGNLVNCDVIISYSLCV
jgi:hypothetical protein